jgi:hypothetical protein
MKVEFTIPMEAFTDTIKPAKIAKLCLKEYVNTYWLPQHVEKNSAQGGPRLPAGWLVARH